MSFCKRKKNSLRIKWAFAKERMGLSRNELLQKEKNSLRIKWTFAKERMGLSRNELLQKKRKNSLSILS